MVLDTKWKRFKFSSGNKLLCVLLACVMIAILMFNSLQLVKLVSFYQEDVFQQKTTSFYETYPFKIALSANMRSIEGTVTANAREKERKVYIDSAFTAYKKAELENRLSDEEVQALIDRYIKDDGEDEWDWYYDEFDENSSLPSEISFDNVTYYRGEDGNYYSACMTYKDQSIVSYKGNENEIKFGYSDEAAEGKLHNGYYSYQGIYYDSYYNDVTYYENLKNIQYYAVHQDGTVITNVKTDTLLCRHDLDKRNRH